MKNEKIKKMNGFRMETTGADALYSSGSKTWDVVGGDTIKVPCQMVKVSDLPSKIFTFAEARELILNNWGLDPHDLFAMCEDGDSKSRKIVTAAETFAKDQSIFSLIEFEEADPSSPEVEYDHQKYIIVPKVRVFTNVGEIPPLPQFEEKMKVFIPSHGVFEETPNGITKYSVMVDGTFSDDGDTYPRIKTNFWGNDPKQVIADVLKAYPRLRMVYK